VAKVAKIRYVETRVGFAACTDGTERIDRNKDDRVRLAHFIQRYPPALGGSEAYFARLSRFCAAQGDDVTVFTSNALALDAFWSPRGSCLPAGTTLEAGVTVRRYPLLRCPGRRWLLKALSLIPNRLWQCLTMPCNPISLPMWRDAGNEPSRFDAVHASAFPYAFPIACAWRLARRLGVPFFITPFLHLGNPDDPHDPTRDGYTSPPLRWLLQQADAVFVQTPSERAAALRLGLRPENVILQGLGVEPSECTGGDRFSAREGWNLPPDAFVVGHLANNSFEKGTNDLIQALEPLWRNNQPIYLLLAGPAMPNFTRCWQAFEKRCPDFARRWVRRLGPITDAEKRAFFAAIDIFALPSRSDSFGLVLLEAWANGVPSVAYRAGGVADVIRHGVDGLLAACGCIEALTGCIHHLHDDMAMGERFGKTGQERLPGEFSWHEKLALVRRTIAQRTKKASLTLSASEGIAEPLADTYEIFP
jgi:glycosyltransferase involved in cell wall biosynthesis